MITVALDSPTLALPTRTSVGIKLVPFPQDWALGNASQLVPFPLARASRTAPQRVPLSTCTSNGSPALALAASGSCQVALLPPKRIMPKLGPQLSSKLAAQPSRPRRHLQSSERRPNTPCECNTVHATCWGVCEVPSDVLDSWRLLEEYENGHTQASMHLKPINYAWTSKLTELTGSTVHNVTRKQSPTRKIPVASISCTTLPLVKPTTTTATMTTPSPTPPNQHQTLGRANDQHRSKRSRRAKAGWLGLQRRLAGLGVVLRAPMWKGNTASWQQATSNANNNIRGKRKATRNQQHKHTHWINLQLPAGVSHGCQWMEVAVSMWNAMSNDMLCVSALQGLRLCTTRHWRVGGVACSGLGRCPHGARGYSLAVRPRQPPPPQTHTHTRTHTHCLLLLEDPPSGQGILPSPVCGGLAPASRTLTRLAHRLIMRGWAHSLTQQGSARGRCD